MSNTMKPNRFKFRAWDYTHKKMMFDVYPLRVVAGKEEIYIPSVNFSKNGEGHDAVLTMQGNFSSCMQSTGLTDKNGKEIFEGDIVQLDKDCDGWWGGEVKYSEEEALFFIEHDSFEDWNLVADYKIIGNIYENPNLLDAKN